MMSNTAHTRNVRAWMENVNQTGNTASASGGLWGASNKERDDDQRPNAWGGNKNYQIGLYGGLADTIKDIFKGSGFQH